MKKLTIPCQFGNQRQPVDFYIGQPKPDNHPIQNQSHWLSSDRGGVVPAEIMESLQRLHDLSRKNHVPFEELCSYAIESADMGGGEAEAPPAEPASAPENAKEAKVPEQPVAAEYPAEYVAEQEAEAAVEAKVEEKLVAAEVPVEQVVETAIPEQPLAEEVPVEQVVETVIPEQPLAEEVPVEQVVETAIPEQPLAEEVPVEQVVETVIPEQPIAIEPVAAVKVAQKPVPTNDVPEPEVAPVGDLNIGGDIEDLLAEFGDEPYDENSSA